MNYLVPSEATSWQFKQFICKYSHEIVVFLEHQIIFILNIFNNDLASQEVEITNLPYLNLCR